MADPSDNETPIDRLDLILQQARQAAQSGDHFRAYQLSLEATQAAPGNLEAWILRLENAPTLEESLVSLNQANLLQPDNPDLEPENYRLSRVLLSQNSQLKYLRETPDLYFVQSGAKLPLIVPKGRSYFESTNSNTSAVFRFAYLCLWLSLIGLLAAGLGAVIFAPLAALAALSLNFRPISQADRVHSLVLILMSGSLWLSGLLLSVILILHLI